MSIYGNPVTVAHYIDSSLTVAGAAADAKATGDAIGDVKSTINNSVPVGTVTDGYYINKNTGAATSTSSGSATITGFLKVSPLSTLKFENIRTDLARGVCFYSSNTEDSFVSAADFSSVTSGTAQVPANANYVRATGYPSLGDLRITVVNVVGYIDAVYTASKAKDAQIDKAIEDVQDKIDDIVLKTNKSICTIADFTIQGYLNSDGSFTATSGGNKQRTTDFIEINPVVWYTLEYSALREVCVYDANKTFLLSLASSDVSFFMLAKKTNGAGAKYMRLNISSVGENSYVYLYAVKTGKGTQETLNQEIDVPQAQQTVQIPWVKMRHPLIAFILDGDWDLNATMHDIFAAHHVKCGYAPQYKTDYSNVPLATYLEWQADGFELLVHGQTNLSDDTTLTDDEAIARIEESYNWQTANGMNVKGYITLQGDSQAKFVPYIAKYFDWAATTHNHYGALESCIFYGTDRPYFLWRYGMQTSTLQQMKDAVDRCLANNALLLFYGHADSTVNPETGLPRNGYFTPENLDALLTYIESVGGEIVRPTEAVKDYFAVRYDDIYNILHT